MNNIPEIMLGAIGSQICGREYVIENISDEALGTLYKLSKHHDMAHIVASELIKQGLLKDDEIGAKFKKQQMLAVLRYERINYELSELCRVLEEAEIPHMPLKGSVIRRYYSEPWMRTSADIDILIHEEDLQRAIAAIVKVLNYEVNEKNEYNQVMTAPSGVNFELHFATIIEGQAVNAKEILDDIWQYSYLEEGFSYHYCIVDEWFYFYHIAHMAKHFECSGCGVRFFLDTWILNHRREFDREKRNEILSKGGLLNFAKAAENLADVWFSGTSHTKMTVQIQSRIINSGIYGIEENSTVWQQIQKGGKFRRALSLIFLPYKDMVKRYPSIKGKKILLPFYQVRRWFSTIFGGRTKSAVNTLKKNADISEDKRNSDEQMLRELGLIK